MLTNFESQEAKTLRKTINQSVFDFVLNPSIAKDIDRLQYLENRCKHDYINNTCIHCGKEQDR